VPLASCATLAASVGKEALSHPEENGALDSERVEDRLLRADYHLLATAR
jgi:hypothetical protein